MSKEGTALPKEGAVAKRKREDPLGTVFNPHVVGAGYVIQFQYDDTGSYIECCLHEDGRLEVRTSGSHSDMLSIDCHVGNAVMVVPRRWNNEHNRYVQLVKEERSHA